ncbi:FdhF/YdeP family oxidoreductase [Cryptosporangium aurantiacum]|uniref:Oxidoreductase alpha (Molybdopterin) subunit n=1 Tax=Cryptosporangium aurantiacum TaxID=134849 RepID=A0A1M7MS47_9ACTN|nr:FdhF/YdeP family oxidoreductase [Cryptosporangium aurantiacum]SHM93796.1 oxidoreductase alpha (molybdopterin) subunit [Cryptosporangium aurantiacum]
MVTKPPTSDIDERELTVTPAKHYAAGIPAVVQSLRHAGRQMSAGRTLLTLAKVNQKDGFDCPGCAWPDPDHRSVAEFCENGAKAVAEEATERRVDADFFAAYSAVDLADKTDYWLGQQGRLTEPMFLARGKQHYEPISWDAAFDLIASELAALDSPDQASFYTSGRTSNEAAFLYQLFVRAFGTNNLPDCSNMCHESSGSALIETLGVGKGSVSLEDLYKSDLIFVVGQNPGTNHPRMLSALEKAKKAGASIIAVNPLPEAGLMRFKNPQKASGVVGRGTPLADDFAQIRLNGDLALFQALNRLLLESDGALDRDFIAKYTHGFEEFSAGLKALNWDDVLEATGLDRAVIERIHQRVLGSQRIVVCWAMGLTQHKNAVPTIREIVNFLLLRGNVGRPGAGVCPVRGHSNVQGDRTMGIYEKPAPAFLDALADEFGFEPPREHGFDVVDSIRALRDGDVKVFVALGGNFVSATPDTAVTEAALRNARLTVQISTKLNRSHTVTGEQALILPTLGRTEHDHQASGPQFVTVEDSMCAVHASHGRLKPASPHLRSEVAIVCGLAERTLAKVGNPPAIARRAEAEEADRPEATAGDRPEATAGDRPEATAGDRPEAAAGVAQADRAEAGDPEAEPDGSVPEATSDASAPERGRPESGGAPSGADETRPVEFPWGEFVRDYDTIRDRISRVVPGFDDFNTRVRVPGGFVLPHAPRDERKFPTANGKANFTVNALEVIRIRPDRLILQTVRSHDQYNTTIYGLDDRYRGVHSGRRVVFVNPDDLASLGIADGEHVDLVSEYTDGERVAPDFRVIAYDTARGCCAAYFPETNVLVPLDSTAEISNTPVSKSIVIRLERREP